MLYRVLFPCVIEGKAHIDGLVDIKTRDWYILKLLASKMLEPVIESAPESVPEPIKKPRGRAKK